MHNGHAKTYVLSLGGSLIIPNGGFDTEFLSKFNTFIREKINAGMRFFITCGGGTTARKYIDAATAVLGNEIKDIDKDWLGIHSTRLNAHLIKTLFRDLAYTYMIKHYDLVDKNAKEEKLVIAGGWKPGWSTDFCATLLAEDYGIDTVINLSNINQVYDKDPRKFSDAKPIDRMSWDEIIAIVGDTWTPGLNVPFDPIAAAKAKEIGLKVIIINGNNFENFDAVLEGREFLGTVIE
ncbi:MAG: UMP kinase [Patescibacteria group bacterium]|jgi:uridylate kinase